MNATENEYDEILEETTVRHPLLVEAGIDDIFLRLDFEEIGMIVAPDLTFQYTEEGELDTSSGYTYTPLCEETPARYREQFIKRWTIAGSERCNDQPLDGEKCWVRLQELLGKQLTRLPDNPFTLKAAWVAGLVQEMPPAVRQQLDMLKARIAACVGEQSENQKLTELAASTGQPQIIKTYMTDRCCNGNSDECSFDSATEYVNPDGTHATKFTCCF